MAKDNKVIEGGWSSLSSRKKTIMVLIVVALILLCACYLYIEIRNSTDITQIDESEFQRQLMVVDGLKWEIAKNDYKRLVEILNSATGIVRTFVDDNILILEVDSKDFGIWAAFCYDSGYIVGLLDLIPAKVFFSESFLKSGRALTLSINGEMFIFYCAE